MTAITVRNHERFLEALGDRVLGHGDLDTKPLDVDLAPPLPTAVRLYMFSLVEGGASRPHEYKAVLRVPGQRVGEYASFEHGGHRLAVLCAYRDDLGVFVVWDASLHPQFKQGGNVRIAKERRPGRQRPPAGPSSAGGSASPGRGRRSTPASRATSSAPCAR